MEGADMTLAAWTVLFFAISALAILAAGYLLGKREERKRFERLAVDHMCCLKALAHLHERHRDRDEHLAEPHRMVKR